MKKNELIKLRELVNIEIKRRKRINELLKNNLVLEYINITNKEKEDLDSNDINDIINKILKSFEITNTNNIYICTDAWYTYDVITYQATGIEVINVSIDSKDAEYKYYENIESKEGLRAVKNITSRVPINETLISDFEKNNIVLNPYNSRDNKNGLDIVRTEFLFNSIINGQAKAKKYILSKYPRLY